MVYKRNKTRVDRIKKEHHIVIYISEMKNKSRKDARMLTRLRGMDDSKGEELQIFV